MPDFQIIFDKLKKNIPALKKGLIVKQDTDKAYYVDTNTEYNKKPMFFGATMIKKNYVSFYLMPVYTNPELLKGMSPELKKRMQGKSCFNFKEVDDTLFKELGELTKKGYEAFKKDGYIK